MRKWLVYRRSFSLDIINTPIPSARQHNIWVMMICLVVKRVYYQNRSVLDCVTQCSQSAAHLHVCEQFLQVKLIAFVTLGPLRCSRGGCLELCYCTMVEWFWWDSSLISTTNRFGHLAFKNRPEMTYYVSIGTLNPTYSLAFKTKWYFATWVFCT